MGSEMEAQILALLSKRPMKRVDINEALGIIAPGPQWQFRWDAPVWVQWHEASRRVDRVLQRLRKAGHIVFRSPSWHHAKAKACPVCLGTGQYPAEGVSGG